MHRGAVPIGKLSAQDGVDFLIHLIPSEIPEGLDQRAAFAAGGGHIPRSGVLEDDFLLPELHLPGRAVREEHDAGRHLLRKAEHIGGIGAGGLESSGSAPCESMGHGVGGGSHGTEDGVLHRVIVEATRQPPDRAVSLESLHG